MGLLIIGDSDCSLYIIDLEFLKIAEIIKTPNRIINIKVISKFGLLFI